MELEPMVRFESFSRPFEDGSLFLSALPQSPIVFQGAGAALFKALSAVHPCMQLREDMLIRECLTQKQTDATGVFQNDGPYLEEL